MGLLVPKRIKMYLLALFHRPFPPQLIAWRKTLEKLSFFHITAFATVDSVFMLG
jgi:hypothetical protein